HASTRPRTAVPEGTIAAKEAPSRTAPARGSTPAGERTVGTEKTAPAAKKPIKRTARRDAAAPSGANQGKTAPVRTAAVPASAGVTAAEPAGKPAKQQIEVEMLKPADLIISRGPVDRPLLIIILVMLCFGAVMVFSASYAAALNEKGTSYYYIIRHIAYIGIGAGLAFVEMAILKYRFDLLKRFSWLIFLIGLGLLAFVLVNGYARGVAKRWIFIGSFSFQPSEFMKLALVLFLATYLSNNQKKILDKRFWYASWYGDFIPAFILAVPCGLIFLENHLSGTIITFLIGLFVIWAAGSRWPWFLAVLLIGGAAFYIAVNYIPYVALRWDEFVHPENYSVTDELWQTIQGQIAVGSGGWFGVGLGNSRQKHMFVSQPQNDFIFSIICEELGFIGALFVIALFLAFIIRGMTVALRAPDTFSCLTAVGITSQIGIQAILNMMVVTGVIPNTGISLPFFSYGGSSILMLMIEMGILLSISRFSYQKE
ncbi:MAG: FtsW/RodA/SpoVE family cell cycle protein, partial [Lachnospiraceae bacterium]|nr:FtsW/RodA/SpoVE family cell cycle protein [Lachnospiraceae bacterium]